MITKLMLACSTNVTQDDLQRLQYPVYVSEKIDGIRCLLAIRGGKVVALSRKLIQIPNLLVQQWAENHGLPGLDGELTIPGLPFHDTQSKIMTQITFPFEFKFKVFDHWESSHRLGYLQRLQKLRNRIEMYGPDRTKVLKTVFCENETDVERQFRLMMEEDKEGLIIRSPDGPYKQGRSTFNEGWMLKMKAFIEREAIIIDFEPEYENQNTQTKDRTGSAKRSSHQANLKPRNRVGALVVRDCETDKVFRIGSGLSHDLKKEIWDNRSHYLGQIVTYKYQLHGTKIKPRTPIFRGVRKD